MASGLMNVLDCVSHYSGVYEQNSIMDWTAERAIITEKGHTYRSKLVICNHVLDTFFNKIPNIETL